MVAEQPRAAMSRIWAIAVLVVVPLTAIRLSYLLWSSRLPDPLPTHWNPRGEVDGTTATATFLTVMSAVAIAGGLLALVGALATRIPWGTRRGTVTVGAAVSAFAAMLWLITAGLALDHTDAYQVPAPSWHLVLLLPALAVWAGLGFAAYGPTPQAPAATGRPATDLPRVGLLAGQRALWSESSHPGRMAYLTLGAVGAMAVVLGVWISPWAASPLLFTGALVLYLFTTWLLVDQRGVHVAFGPWRWPRLTVPLREITSARVTTVRPSEWGGWGYRIRRDGRALVLRQGPGVWLELSGGRHFVASTRDPETVAGLVNSLIDRERAAEV